MTRFQRIKGFLAGLLLILCGLTLISLPEENFEFVAILLGLYLIFAGLKNLVYYFTMARHMVGGQFLLIMGVIIFDFGVYSFSLFDDSSFIIISYLTGIHLFSGALNLVKALSEIRSSISFWKTDMLQAGVNFVMAVLCLTFRHTPSVLVYLYAAGLFYSAAVRIWSVFRRTAIVYIS